MAAALVGTFIGAIVTLTILPIPQSNDRLLNYMLGQLSGFASIVIGAYFTRRADQTQLDERRDERSAAMVAGLTEAVIKKDVEK